MAKSIIHNAMPDWDGNESIVAYSIRKRAERKAHAEAVHMLALLTMTPAILAAVVGFTAIVCDIVLKSY